ncbi:nuclease [Arenimonas oryziterrae]|uniref:Calx-beta domain-containing protein n=1 Tax=Arenimonas oryziterrae DSM 21050 = YC6267 TaxID=1121015 RepID=A0A091BDZ7_9GAMM|nr:nuclease [Arenimonas oryziterrae]KFN42635.1 hypothetical protein N789_13420 [Arenimonas oryziterrae DSM 21050 = YC6267]
MGRNNRVSWWSKLLSEKALHHRHVFVADRSAGKLLIALLALAASSNGFAQTCVSLAAGNYGQNFDSLAGTGTAANTTLPAGWYMLESGTAANTTYTAGTGSGTSGDTYSFGSATTPSDRALGMLRSGSLAPVVGACFVNDTGAPLSSVALEYIGEEWRLGAASRTDSLVFNYSTDATSLSTGTWSAIVGSPLDFVTPATAAPTGAKDGNVAANRTQLSHNLGVSIPAGATLWVRWTDVDVSGSDDGLAIDNFLLSMNAGPVTPNLAIGDVAFGEGDSGSNTMLFTITLSSAAGPGGVQFNIHTSDGSATVADGDYVAASFDGQTIPQGSTSGIFTVQINGDTTPEANETFLVDIDTVTGANVTDAQAIGTIQNDDFVLVPVHAIQGSGSVSPYAVGSIVATEGIVTARTSNGFFVQTPDAEVDADPATSEGVFVFTSTAPPASAAVGNRVRINATLDEYNPGGQLPLTELKNATVVQVGSGNPLPAPIVLTVADANAASPLGWLERYEGMRVSVPSLKVIAPVDGNITESSAVSSSNGLFYGVLPTIARPMREPGIDVLDPIVPPPGVTPPVFDHNPEMLRVRSNGQTGAPIISVDVGDTVNGLVGVLDYGFAYYTITPDPAAGASVVLGSQATAVSARATDEITIGGFNLLHFFDDVADGNGATKLTTLAYQNRLKKTGNAICAYTRNPDVLGVIEVEHIKALTDLADSINANGGNALFPNSCSENPHYQAYLIEGNDIGGIDVGFLLKTTEVAAGKPRVEVVSIEQIGKDALFTNADNSTELLNDRPPLVLVARINQANGASQTVTVIANHLRSLIDVNTTTVGTKGWATVGDRVRAKRGEQARFLAALIQARQTANPNEKIVLLGDFNAFEFNDGFVDSMGIVTGREAGPTQVLRYVDSPITTPLTNTAELAPAAERYSFSFDGNAQSLDHMVVNQAVLDSFAGVRAEHARINADFGIDNYGDFAVPVRVSDHDPVVLFLQEASFRTTALSVTMPGPPFDVVAGDDMDFVVNVGNAGDAPVGNIKLDLTIHPFFGSAPGAPLPAVDFPALLSVDVPSGWSCGAFAEDTAGYFLAHCTSSTSSIAPSNAFVVTMTTSLALDDIVVSLGAAVSSSATDSDPADNSATRSHSIYATRDLVAQVQGPAGPLKVGEETKFLVTMANEGQADETHQLLSVRVNAPAGAVRQIVSPQYDCLAGQDTPTDSVWVCEPLSGEVLVAGTSKAIVVTVAPTFAQGNGALTVEATLRTVRGEWDWRDPNAGNNVGTVSVPVVGHGIPPQPVPSPRLD